MCDPPQTRPLFAVVKTNRVIPSGSTRVCWLPSTVVGAAHVGKKHSLVPVELTDKGEQKPLNEWVQVTEWLWTWRALWDGHEWELGSGAWALLGLEARDGGGRHFSCWWGLGWGAPQAKRALRLSSLFTLSPSKFSYFSRVTFPLLTGTSSLNELLPFHLSDLCALSPFGAPEVSVLRCYLRTYQ